MVTYIFCCFNNSLHIIFFNLKKFKKTLSEEKKDIGKSVQKSILWNANIMAMRTTTIQTFNIYAVLNGVIFGQISYDIVPYAWHFLPVRFFPKNYLINYALSYRKS